jgi:hypothetical protein
MRSLARAYFKRFLVKWPLDLAERFSRQTQENIMCPIPNSEGRRAAAVVVPRNTLRRVLVAIACPAALIWFGLCLIATGQFGVFGHVLLARPSLLFGLLLLAVTVVAFGMLPRPRLRRDRYALALSLAMSAFTIVSFAVASRLTGV